MLNKAGASQVYLFIEFVASASFSMMFVAMLLYEATIAGLTPFQLIMDAIGQIGGGPSVALVARSLLVAAAITTSALLLGPAMLLVNRATLQSDIEPDAETASLAEG